MLAGTGTAEVEPRCSAVHGERSLVHRSPQEEGLTPTKPTCCHGHRPHASCQRRLRSHGSAPSRGHGRASRRRASAGTGRTLRAPPRWNDSGAPHGSARRNPAPKGNGRRNDVRDRCRKPAESDEVEDDHPALRHLLIVTPRARGLRKRGPFERKFQNRPFELASPLFFFTASDLVDDERREHNAPRRAGGCFSDSTEPSCLFK